MVWPVSHGFLGAFRGYIAANTYQAAVNLLVFPVSSRLVVFKELAGGIGLLRKLVSLQKAYLASLEPDAAADAAIRTKSFLAETDGGLHEEEDNAETSKEAQAVKALEATGAALRELAGKLQADTGFAKRDIAWGKLSAKDISQTTKLFRSVYVPVYVFISSVDVLLS